MQRKTLKQALEAEARTLKDFAELQRNLQKAIGRRQWAELNADIENLRALADKIEALEEERAQAWKLFRKAVKAGEREGFAEIVTRLPAEERDELLMRYRHLKAAVIRVKASAGLLNYYVQSMSEALRQVLGELFPHRKGKLYSRSGKPKEAGDESFMLYGNA